MCTSETLALETAKRTTPRLTHIYICVYIVAALLYAGSNIIYQPQPSMTDCIDSVTQASPSILLLHSTITQIILLVGTPISTHCCHEPLARFGGFSMHTLHKFPHTLDRFSVLSSCFSPHHIMEGANTCRYIYRKVSIESVQRRVLSHQSQLFLAQKPSCQNRSVQGDPVV